MTTASTIRTAEQLHAATYEGRGELVEGTFQVRQYHQARDGMVVSAIGRRICDHADAFNLGLTCLATGFVLSRNPDTVRAPDVAFVTKDRLHLVPPRGYFPGAPDLAVEVLSPDDSASEVLAKVEDWLSAGTKEVWIADPQRKTLVVHGQDQPMRVFSVSETVTSESLLPGLQMPLSDVFR